MSCLGPYYNPNPTREWFRYENRCPDKYILSTYQYKKGNILQYKGNSSNLTKNQRYSQIAKGMWTNRTKSWATQSDKYTNPNTNYLKQTFKSNVIITNNIIDNNNPVKEVNINCQNFIPPPQFIVSLPNQPITGDPGNNPIIPPQPSNPSQNDFTLPPSVPLPEETVVYVKDGGNLLCNSVEVFSCNSNVPSISFTRKNPPIQSFPNTFSNVPGFPTLLYWDNNLQTYYPRVKRTYGTSGDKWPQGSKFIFPVYSTPNNKKPVFKPCIILPVYKS